MYDFKIGNNYICLIQYNFKPQCVMITHHTFSWKQLYFNTQKQLIKMCLQNVVVVPNVINTYLELIIALFAAWLHSVLVHHSVIFLRHCFFLKLNFFIDFFYPTILNFHFLKYSCSFSVLYQFLSKSNSKIFCNSCQDIHLWKFTYI